MTFFHNFINGTNFEIFGKLKIKFMKKENFSIVERQILANQFKILSQLAEEGSYEAENFEKKAEILKRGYTSEYSEVFDVNLEEVPTEICEETNEILNMYRTINNSIARLSEEEKEQLDLESIEFQGFDANNDSHYHYAKYMIEHLDKWQEHKDMCLNSHSRLPLMKYRRMLPIQEAAFQENRFELNFEDLQKMINAI